MIKIGYRLNLNLGDLLNFPIFHYYLEDKQFLIISLEYLKKEKEIYLGIGTLPDLHLPYDWFRDKQVTLLGTGTRYFDQKWTGLNLKGFARGKLSEQKLGLPGLGDLGLLADRVFGRTDLKTDVTLAEFDHLIMTNHQLPQMDLPNIKLISTVRSIVTIGTMGIYKLIHTSRYVVTDRLHFAVLAEASEVPWVIYDHGEGGLTAVPQKFIDWASTIGKEKFVVTKPEDIGIVIENTDFEQSARQKDILEKALYEATAEKINANIS